MPPTPAEGAAGCSFKAARLQVARRSLQGCSAAAGCKAAAARFGGCVQPSETSYTPADGSADLGDWEAGKRLKIDWVVSTCDSRINS